MRKALAISKLDAAKRQLETAIRLYFSYGDPVSIHTLTAAAYNVIRDINEKRGGPPLLVKDQTPLCIKPERQKAYRDKLNEAENFFRHADRDHDATLDFSPHLSEMMILDACRQYGTLTGEEPPLFKVYGMWFMANNPDIFTFPEEQKQLFLANCPSITEMGRVAYFNAAVSDATRIEA